MKKLTSHCSYCGKKMNSELRGAEESRVGMSCGGDWVEFPFASAYDTATGKRQYIRYYKCPDYKNKKWYQVCSPHDEYYINEIVSGLNDLSKEETS